MGPALTANPVIGPFTLNPFGQGTGVISTAGFYAMYLSYAVGGTAASDSWAAAVSLNVYLAPGRKSHRHTGVAASAVVAEKFKASSASSAANIANRRLLITPVRVG